MDLNALNVAEVDRQLDKDGYLIVKADSIVSLCQPARAEYEQYLRSSKLHAPSERFDFHELEVAPWRKLAIGSRNGLGNPYAQNLQSIYFNPSDARTPALGKLFSTMLGVRNQLMRVDRDFGSRPDRDRFWDACRIHHYPRGGGFMAQHKDTHFPKVMSSQSGLPFYQVSVLLSRKSVDFNTGGGFVVGHANKKVDVEVEGGFGALVIFDGRAFHGVDDIDLDQVIDFSRPDGRLAAFVNLYSVL
jgi:hypothetical protein